MPQSVNSAANHSRQKVTGNTHQRRSVPYSFNSCEPVTTGRAELHLSGMAAQRLSCAFAAVLIFAALVVAHAQPLPLSKAPLKAAINDELNSVCIQVGFNIPNCHQNPATLCSSSLHTQSSKASAMIGSLKTEFTLPCSFSECHAKRSQPLRLQKTTCYAATSSEKAHPIRATKNLRPLTMVYLHQSPTTPPILTSQHHQRKIPLRHPTQPLPLLVSASLFLQPRYQPLLPSFLCARSALQREVFNLSNTPLSGS